MDILGGRQLKKIVMVLVCLLILLSVSISFAEEPQSFDQTIADMTMILADNPNDANSYYGRGLAYERLNLYTEAIQAYKNYIAYIPASEDPKWIEITKNHIRDLGGTV